MMRYQSHAVTAQRIEPKDSPDDFPTPPWATRALIEHVFDGKATVASMSCLEPACGAGHMAKVLKEYFGEVRCADAFPYGYAPIRDFLTYPYETNAFDWVITNPPFRTRRGICCAFAPGRAQGRRNSRKNSISGKCWQIRNYLR